MVMHQTQLHTTTLSPKDLLRAHVERLSPAQQREFIAAALELIALRDMLDEVEVTASRLQPSSMHTVAH